MLVLVVEDINWQADLPKQISVSVLLKVSVHLAAVVIEDVGAKGAGVTRREGTTDKVLQEEVR